MITNCLYLAVPKADGFDKYEIKLSKSKAICMSC